MDKQITHEYYILKIIEHLINEKNYEKKWRTIRTINIDNINKCIHIKNEKR